MSHNALGLIETKGLIGAIEACDAAAKAAAVVISSAELTDAALMTIKIEGELGAVQAAVDSGARAAERVGELISAHVIPRPDENLGIMIGLRRYESKYHPDDRRPPLPWDDDGKSGPPPPKPPRPKPPAPATAAKEPPQRPKAPEPKPPSVETRPKPPAPKPPDKKQLRLKELEDMPVRKLRQFARTLENLPIKGRQISMANKQQLIEAIKTVINLE